MQFVMTYRDRTVWPNRSKAIVLSAPDYGSIVQHNLANLHDAGIASGDIQTIYAIDEPGGELRRLPLSVLNLNLGGEKNESDS